MNLFDIAKLEKEITELESETVKEGFWNDSKKSGMILQKMKIIKDKIEKFYKLNNELDELIEMSELVDTEIKESRTSYLRFNTAYRGWRGCFFWSGHKVGSRY